MSLNNMTLNQLRELALTLGNLEIAGSTLGSCGLEPLFDLTPGKMVTMTVPFLMPDDTSIAPWRINQGTGIWYPATPETEAARVDAYPDPVPETPEPSPLISSADDVSGHSPLPVEPLAADVNTGEAGDGGAGKQHPVTPAIAELPAIGEAVTREGEVFVRQPDPVPASPKAMPWTQQEDIDLIARVVLMMQTGIAKGAAIATVAADMGRPYEGTRFRLGNKLADDFAAALAAAAKTQAQSAPKVTEAEPTPQPRPVPTEAAKAAAPVPTPAPAKTAPPSDALDFHLSHLSNTDSWNTTHDIELLELTINGWDIPSIAMQMQIGSREIKARFDLLTGLYTDAQDKKARRFKREDVLAALTKRAVAA